MQVLYLFSGAERKAVLGNCIVKDMSRVSWKTGFECEVLVSSIDILRGGAKGDLLVEHRRLEILASILEGRYDLVLAAPPCNTFSRALHHDTLGPAPLRDRQAPWGKPGLSGFAEKKTSDANCLLAFSLAALQAAAKCSSKKVGAWLEFPEDLGDAAHGEPASLWQLPEALALSSLGLVRGAIYQCEWSEADYSNPPGSSQTCRR
jgi:hypothetical protein